MGGEARTAQIKAMLTDLKETHGCRLCVLTRGETASLRIFFEKVTPDWAPLFEGGWVANTFNDYFTCSVRGLSVIYPTTSVPFTPLLSKMGLKWRRRTEHFPSRRRTFPPLGGTASARKR